jgi:tetratricopeptide (TPR) repeat protein
MASCKKISDALRLMLLATALVAVAGCGSVESRKDRALAKGQEYMNAGKLDKARVEFRNALQLVPNDAQGRYLNGVVQERLGNLREAGQFYQAAVDINPEHVLARGGLARLFLLMGSPARALEVLKPGLEKHPDDAAMLAIRAAARSQQKDAAGALEDAEAAYRIDPKDENVVAVLAGLSTANGNTDKARTVLEAGLKEHPQSVDLRFALAQLYDGLHEDAKAEALLREVIALKPDERAHRLRLALFLSSKGRDADAEATLREGIAALPTDRNLKNSLVALLLAKRGRPAAEAELQKMIATAGDDHSAQFALASLYVSGGERPKAEDVYRAIIAKDRTHAAGLEARNHLAALAAASGDAAGAQKLLGEVLEASPHDSDALLLRGELTLAKGDPKDAIVDFRSVLRDQPNSPGVLRVLARAHVRNGEPALAEEALRHAFEANPADAGVARDLVAFLLENGKAEQAKAIAQQITKAHPDDVDAQQLAYRAAAAGHDYVAARAAAEAIVASSPKLPSGYFFLGMLDEEQGRPDDALREYDRALAVEPAAVEPLQAMTRLLVSKKREADAVKRLDELAARAPQSGLALGAKAEVLLEAKRYADAEAAAHAAIERVPKWSGPYRTLARVALAKGDRSGALAILQDALPKVGDPIPVRLQLVDLYQAAAGWDQAIGEYEEVLKAVPGNVAAANNLAMLLVDHHADAAGLARAGELVKGFADSRNASLLDTYGWVRFRQGDAKAAVAALEKATGLLPAAPELRYHLGMAQAAAGLKAQATDNLKQAVSSGRKFSDFDAARAELGKIGSGS